MSISSQSWILRLDVLWLFEALARWHNSELGEISPASFIPIAERTGQIHKMTRLLLQKALKVASEWPDNVQLSFNLSNHDIGSPESVSAHHQYHRE